VLFESQKGWFAGDNLDDRDRLRDERDLDAVHAGREGVRRDEPRERYDEETRRVR
jgi:hypothetical protein